MAERKLDTFNFSTRRRSLLLALTAYVMLASSSLFAQTKGDEQVQSTCLTVSPMRVDTVLIGAAKSESFLLTAFPTDSLYLQLNLNSIDTQFRFVTPKFPAHLDKAQQDTAKVVFAPVDSGLQLSVITFLPSNSTASCDSVVLDTLKGYGLRASADSAVFPLFSGPHAIGITTLSDSVVKTIQFKNDSTASIKIDSIYLKNGSAFSIDSIGLPLTIPANSAIPVKLHYRSQAVRQQDMEQLVIVPNQPILTEVYQLYGTKLLAFKGVPVTHTVVPLTIEIMPNPSSGIVTIQTTGLRNGTLEIFDILGRSVTQRASSSSWNWNGRTNAGAKASAGVYIVRVSGRDEAGRAVVTSKRLVIE